MPRKTKPIPVNPFIDDLNMGISIERIVFKDLPSFDGIEQPERHDCHSFFLIESGTVTIEIDFQKYKVKPRTILYMHPDQVHRITAFDKVVVSCWAINNENLNPEYLKSLEAIVPAKPLLLNEDGFTMISEAVSLCSKCSERKGHKLYHSLLKDSCNMLVALVISHYTEREKGEDALSRLETVSKAFKELLGHHYARAKRPLDYAEKLHISVPYLNECVKNATGHPVSYHIRQRIVLEAKRLLYHSDRSVKEIATELGYEDYPYFSRLFSKVAGMSPLSFRMKNRD